MSYNLSIFLICGLYSADAPTSLILNSSFIDSNTFFLSSTLLKGLFSPLSFLTFSSESIPTYNLVPNDFVNSTWVVS